MVVKIVVPFWGTLNIRGRIIIGIQKGTIIFTTTHIVFRVQILVAGIPRLFGTERERQWKLRYMETNDRLRGQVLVVSEE